MDSTNSKTQRTKIRIIIISVLLVIGICIGTFIIINLNNSSKPNITEEKLVELSDENYVVFEEGFTDIKVTDEKSALEAVGTVADVLGISDINQDLKIISNDSFDGDTFYRMQQYYKGFPVYGHDVILAANQDGIIKSLSSNTVKIEDQVSQADDIKNELTEEEVITVLQEHYSNPLLLDNNGTYYLNLNNGKSFLVNQYTVIGLDSSVEYGIKYDNVFISKDKKDIVYTESILLQNDYNYDGYMYDKKRNVLMLNSNRGLACWSANDDVTTIFDKTGLTDDTKVLQQYIETNDPKSNPLSDVLTTRLLGAITYEQSSNGQWNKDAETIIKNAELTYDFYLSILNRKGYDDKGSILNISYNDSVDDGKNAFSSNNLLTFGYQKNSSSIDLVAHEYTHSVEQTISHMTYRSESGAIMEAYSDIFGEIVEDYSDGKLDNSCDWKHESTRNIKVPADSRSIDGENRQYPQKYKEQLTWHDVNDLEYDNGGVHRNSTVISHAAYLMSVGINGDDTLKIDTELLAKIWYKSMFLLHPNATFKQCADAVYNAALMTKGVTFDQLVCIRAAFGEAGIDVEAITTHNVLNGTTIYAISSDNKKYQNYHVRVINCDTKKTVDEKDITDANGYKLNLESGTYIISLTDNEQNGSTNTYNKTIYLRNIPGKEVNSYINILTDFYKDFDTPLKEKLTGLLTEYGVASSETYTANTNTTNSKSWTNREGLVSAKLSDLDGDGINELVVVRLIGGELNPYSENIELQVYYYADGEVKSAGSIKFLTGDDYKQKQIDSFIYKIGNKRYIMFESDFTILATDSSEMYYDLISYNNGKIHKDRSIYLGDSDYGARWIEKIWDGDIESEQDIYFKDLEHTTATGTYKGSEDPILDYFKDFGLPKTEDAFELSRHHKYLNVNGSEKLFELIHSRVQTDLYKYSSSLTDYTDLDHSKSTTSAEKVEEWKELYISHFKEQENKSTLDYASFHIVDVNEDGTPELVYTGFAAMGTHMVWVKDGVVQNQAVRYGEFKYIPSKNQIYCQYVNYGMTNDNVYSFTDRDLEKTFSGQILPKENGFENPGWSVNGENVSESEYNSQLKNAFNFDSSKSLDYEDSINGSDLLSRIKDY